MRILSIRRIGVILVLVGVVLIGFFGLWNAELGSIGFPFAAEIGGFVSTWTMGALEYTSAWWSAKLIGMSMGFIGLMLVRFG